MHRRFYFSVLGWNARLLTGVKAAQLIATILIWGRSVVIRLTYFNFPFWRAEPSRIALFMAGIEFEDVRPGRDEFRAMKQSGELPFGQLPVLDVDGTRISQSNAIARYCGKLAGLYPDNLLEAAKVDECLSAPDDVMLFLAHTMREKDPEKKRALRSALVEERLQPWLTKLNQRLTENTSSPFAVGETLTIADLVLWRFIGWLKGGILDGVPTTVMDEHLRLLALYDWVEALPQVQAWHQREG